MKKIISVLLIAVIAVSGLFAAVQLTSGPAATVYLIRNTVITRSQLDEEVALYRSQVGNQITASEVLEIMINDELVLQGAERDGIRITDMQIEAAVSQLRANLETQVGRAVTNEEFESFVQANTGMTLAEYREALRESYLVDSYVQSAKGDMLTNIANPTDTEINNFYRRNATQFVNPEYVRISHIFSPYGETDAENASKKANLEKVLSDIKAGRITFERAVATYSEDTDSRNNGGDIGWIAAGNQDVIAMMGNSFVEACLDLDAGEVSSSVIESNAGYHIVKVTVHTEPKFLGIDDPVNPTQTTTVRQYISQRLLAEKQQTAYLAAIDSLIADLRAAATIRILYTE